MQRHAQAVRGGENGEVGQVAPAPSIYSRCGLASFCACGPGMSLARFKMLSKPRLGLKPCGLLPTRKQQKETSQCLHPVLIEGA